MHFTKCSLSTLGGGVGTTEAIIAQMLQYHLTFSQGLKTRFVRYFQCLVFLKAQNMLIRKLI